MMWRLASLLAVLLAACSVIAAGEHKGDPNEEQQRENLELADDVHKPVCSPVYAVQPEPGILMRLCHADRVEIVDDPDSVPMSAVLVGRFNEEQSTENTHFFNIGGTTCSSSPGESYEAEAIFTCCLMPGVPKGSKEGHINSVMSMSPCFYVMEVCSLSACSKAAFAAHEESLRTLAPLSLLDDPSSAGERVGLATQKEEVVEDVALESDEGKSVQVERNDQKGSGASSKSSGHEQIKGKSPDQNVEVEEILISPDTQIHTISLGDILVDGASVEDMMQKLQGLLNSALPESSGSEVLISGDKNIMNLKELMKKAKSSGIGSEMGNGNIVKLDLNSIESSNAGRQLKNALGSMLSASGALSGTSVNAPVEKLAEDPEAADAKAAGSSSLESRSPPSASSSSTTTRRSSSPSPAGVDASSRSSSYSSDDDFLRTQMIERERLRTLAHIREMFIHAYDSYITHAFPLDELTPLTCAGKASDLTGGGALTLVDTLDTLVVMGNYSEFARAVRLIESTVNFDIDLNVSVFETTIRVLGGLISGHVLAAGLDSGKEWTGSYSGGTGDRGARNGDLDVEIEEAFASTGSGEPYSGKLLEMAVDIADRMMPAFDTVTGIPIGTVNLLHGVPVGETPIASTAGGGSLYLEFGMLSTLTGNSSYARAARKALLVLYSKRSKRYNLVGMHINTKTSDWTEKVAGIGSNVDSFFEYLLKSYVLFGDAEMYQIFNELYDSVKNHLTCGPWYVDSSMSSAKEVRPVFNNLQAFWPGMQALVGDVEEAAGTLRAFHLVRQSFGFTPETFHFRKWKLDAGNSGANGYPLRPELAESTYLLHEYAFLRGVDTEGLGRDKTLDANVAGGAVATSWLAAAREMVQGLNRTRVRCGFASVADIANGKLEDHMPSFYLSETLKYLYLTFDFDNPFRQNHRNYVFSTEAHIFPLSLKGSRPQEAMRDLSIRPKNDGETRDPQTNLSWGLKCPKLPWWKSVFNLPYLSYVGVNTIAVQRNGGGVGVKKASSARQSRLNGDLSTIVDKSESGKLLFNVDGVGEFEVTPFGGGFSVLNRLDGTFMEISNLGLNPIIAYSSRSVVDDGSNSVDAPEENLSEVEIMDDLDVKDSGANKEVKASHTEQTASRYVFNDGSVRDCAVRRIDVGGQSMEIAASETVSEHSRGEQSQYIPCSPAAFGKQILRPFGSVQGLLYAPEASKDGELGDGPEGSAGNLFQGCAPYTLPPNLVERYKNIIVLVARGSCTFERKVWNAEQAGAVGVVVSLVKSSVNPFIMAGGGEFFANESPEESQTRSKQIANGSPDHLYSLIQTSIPAVMIDLDSANELRRTSSTNLAPDKFISISDNIVPESEGLLEVMLNMTNSVGMRKGSNGVEQIISGIRAIGPSDWGMNMTLTGTSWQLGIFQHTKSTRDDARNVDSNEPATHD